MEAGTGVRPLKAGVFSSYGNGWRQIWKYFLELLLMLSIIAALAAVIWAFSLPNDSQTIHLNDRTITYTAGFLSLLVYAYSFLFLNPIQYGLSFTFLEAARGDKLEVKDILAGFKNYWNVVLANLLTGVIIFLGLVLFIVPGIVFACKLAFVPYLAVDKKMGVVEAVKKSWHMSGGHAWKVFWIGVLGFFIAIGGVICLGVGFIIAIMWISAALASLYHAIDVSQAQPPINESLPVNP